MWSRSSVWIVINALIFLVHSLPSNIDWNTLRNDSDPIAQNEKILKLFLQLATHTANRLTHLRKKSEKYDCRRNDSPSISTTEALITQLPSQTNIEWLDKNQKNFNHSSSSDSEINSNQNQTVFNLQLQELSDFQNINDNRAIKHNLNSKIHNLIPKSVQDASSNVTKHNHEFNSNILQKPIDLDISSNSLNVNEFRPDSLKSVRNGVNEKVNQALIKNNTNTSIINDLTETVNKFFPNSQNLQEPTLEISQRLFDTDLTQIIPKIISNVHGNANQHILPQNTQNIQALSVKNDDIKRRFHDPIIITNTGNMSTQTDKQKDNSSLMNQILSNTKNIVESMIKILPESAKGVNNLLNQVVPQSQDTNTPLKTAEESQNHFAQSNYTQQEQNKNAKQENQFDVGTSIRNNQETSVNDLPINKNNLIDKDNNKQHVPTLLKDSSSSLLRFLSDFNELENDNNKTNINFSSIQTNESANSSIDKESLMREKTERLNQIDEEIKAEKFKEINETKIDYNGQLNPISEDLSQKSEKSELTDIVVEMSALLNQLESNTLTSIMEHQAKSSNDIQSSENVNNIIKSDLEEERRLQDNSSANDRINRLTENQITHIDNDLLNSNSRSFIDKLKDEDLHEQLSEAKLQEISDRFINALRSITEKKMDNNRA